jgi:hypothetical protein
VVAAAFVVLGAALVEGGGHASPVGLLATTGTLVGEVLFSLLAAPLLPRLGPARVSAWTCALAVPMLVSAAAVTGERPRLPTVAEALAFGYLALVLTVGAFLLWYAGLQRLGVARAGVFLGVLPVAALGAACVLDQRPPAPLQATGVLVVAAALTLSMIIKDSERYETSDPSRSWLTGDGGRGPQPGFIDVGLSSPGVAPTAGLDSPTSMKLGYLTTPPARPRHPPDHATRPTTPPA